MGAVRLGDVYKRQKDPHAVQLVPPELHPDRLGRGRGEEVQDATPEGKLARALHLLAPGVAGGGETVAEVVEVVGLPHLQGETGLLQGGGGQGALQKALHRGHHHRGLALGHGPKNRQPLVLPLVGDGGGGVEGELPARQLEHRGAQQGLQVPGQLGPLHLLGAEQHHRPVQLPGDAGGHKGPVHRGQPRGGHGTPPRVNAQEQIFEFGHPLQGCLLYTSRCV